LFLVNVFLRRWVVPIIGLALMILTSIVVGGLYPLFVQQFQVRPSELVREQPYLERNIQATRAAYDIADAEISEYAGSVSPPTQETLAANAGTLNNIRLLDPAVVSPTFNQLQQTAVDEFWAIPSADAKVFNLEMQSELAAAYTYLAELKQLYSKVTGVPDLDPAQVNVGALSGFALRILYGDLLEATNTKRNTYGSLLSEVNARVLAVGGMAEYGTMDVRNVWPDPLPNNGIEQAQTLQIDRAHGLSMETYLTRRGYDVEQESERRGVEDSQRATLGEDLLRSFERGGGMTQ
jgi:hypothetical protein